MNVRWTWIRIIGLLYDIELVTKFVQTLDESAVTRTQVPEFQSQLYYQLCDLHRMPRLSEPQFP